MNSPEQIDPLIARRLGEFEIVSRLGEGGYGAVYRAYQALLDRHAVIKVLRVEHRNDNRLIQRFTREARIASRINHPFAAHIYAFGAEPDGLLWIAMEFVEGTPLDAFLQRSGTIDPDRFADILGRICEVVHHAHELGIVHRDIKPANVMITAHAGRLVPRLLDLGIAKVLDAPESESHVDPPDTSEDASPRHAPRVGTEKASLPHDTVADHTLVPSTEAAQLAHTIAPGPSDQPASPDTGERFDPDKDRHTGLPGVAGQLDLSASFSADLTQAGIIMGSPLYMAPEQWQDPANVDGRVDIYALGALSYEVLTGTRLFDGNSYGELLMAHMTGTVPTLPDGFPVALDEVLKKALEKDPDQRFETAQQLGDAFKRAIDPDRKAIPALDTATRETLINNAPAPIAQCASALAATTRPFRAHRLCHDLLETIAHCAGLLALAVHAAHPPNDESSERDALLQRLARHTLDADEWITLTRELSRPWIQRRATHPMPDLLDLAFDAQGRSAETPLEKLRETLNTFAHEPTPDDDQVLDVLAQRLRKVATIVHAFDGLQTWIWVEAREQGVAEKWMGVTPQRTQIQLRHSKLATGQVAVLDATRRVAFVLSPLVVTGEATPGAPPVMYLFDGRGRASAHLIAPPQGFERHDEDTWHWFTASLAPDDSSSIDAETTVTPYLGLSTFTPDDAGVFFGREKEAERFLNRLRVEPLLAVVGPSGAGKSSFVQAGVIPNLPDRWDAITMRPGHDPIAALVARLEAEDIDASALLDGADGDAGGLGALLRAHARTHRRTIILVIDQFEEIFTLCADAAQRIRFAQALVEAVRSSDDPLRIVITLRDDFLVRAEALPPMRQRLGRAMQLLTTPATEDLRRILVEPARRAGFAFENETLIEDMVSTVDDRAGALPLLAFTAARLWEARDRQQHQLTRRAYDQMGGVGGALAQHADETLDAMPAEHRALVREAFRHLVTSDGTRAVLSRAELEHILAGEDGQTSRARDVVQELVHSRLLVSYDADEDDGGERVEIVHETLLSAWPRFIRWRQADAAGARLRDQLREAARQWDERNRGSGLLWRGDAIVELKLWMRDHGSGLAPTAAAFVNASLTEARRGQRIRRLVVGTVFVALAGLVAVLWWMNSQTETQRQEADHQRTIADQNADEADIARAAAEANADRAQIMLAGLYAEQGRQELLDGDPRKAMLLLLEATSTSMEPTPAVRLMLARAARALEAEQHRMDAHGFAIPMLAVHPDGERVVSASWDKTARIWTRDGTSLAEMKGHTDVLRGVRWSADGKTLITWGDDGRARLWSDDGTLKHTFEGHDRAVADARLSSDASVVLTAGRDGEVHISRPGSPTPPVVSKLSEKALTAADLTSNGETFAAADAAGQLTIGSTTDGATRTRNARHRGRVQGVAFSPDGSKLASAGDDRVVYIWNVETGEVERALYGHAAPIHRVVWSPDGKRLLTASEDGTARVWLAALGLQTALLQGHEGRVMAAAFSADGEKVVTGGDDRSVRVWNARNGQVLATLVGHSDSVLDTAFLGDQVVSSSKDRTVRLWNGNPDTLKATLTGHSGPVSAAVLLPGDRLLTASKDRRALVWSRGRGQPAAALDGHETGLVGAVTNSTGSLVATIDRDGRAGLWESSGVLRTWLQPTADADAHEYGGLGLAFSPDNSRLATWGSDALVRVWDGETGALVLTLSGHTGAIVDAEFSIDGTVLATASDAKDKSARVWGMDNGQQRARMEGHIYELTAVAIGPLGDVVATASSDKTARLWSTETGALLHVLDGHEGKVVDVAFSPDQSQLITAGGDHTAKVWRVSDGQLVASLEGHQEAVTAVRFDASGTLVFTGSGDGSARVWEADTGHLLASLDGHTGPIRSLDVEGATLLTGSEDGTARLWNVALETRDEATLRGLTKCLPFGFREGRLLPIEAPQGCEAKH